MTVTLAKCRGKNTTERWKNESRSQHLQRQENEGRVLSSEAASCWEEAVSPWAHSKQAAVRDCLDSQQTGEPLALLEPRKQQGQRKEMKRKKGQVLSITAVTSED